MATSWEQAQKLLRFAREMRKAQSDAERQLWQSLRRNQLDGSRFRRQHPIGPFIADFASVACRLIVEIDGTQHDDVEDYDRRRTEMLNELGWRVMRFTSSDGVPFHKSVMDTILRDGRPPP